VRIARAAVGFALLVACTTTGAPGIPVSTTGSPAQAPSRPPPNVLIFLADDQPVGTFGAMPNVRHLLIDRGRRFERGYVTDPLCCPSRASILTGAYAHTTGVYATIHGDGSRPWERTGGAAAFAARGGEERSLAAVLDPTYQTALFGKYLNDYRAYADGIHHGYVPGGWDVWRAFYMEGAGYYGYRLNIDGRVRGYGHKPRQLSTDLLGRQLLRWLKRRDTTEPFFAMFAPYAPHAPARSSIPAGDAGRFADLPPYRSPAFDERDVSDKPSYIRRQTPLSSAERASIQSLRRDQFESLHTFDRWVGRIVRRVERTGEASDTVFIYLSDNGVAWGEHRWRGKLVPYERAIHIPFVVRADGLVRPGLDRRSFALTIDVFPTVMELVFGPDWRDHVPAGAVVEGQSLVPELTGQGSDARGAFLVENLYAPQDNAKVSTPTYCAAVTRRWKYVLYSPTPYASGLVRGAFEQELYDLRRDPFELRDRSRGRPGIVARMRDRLSDLCAPTPPDWHVPAHVLSE
jgi:N-acetylglucosamine-6-sulfatase